jgi:hypothetical protein
MEMELWARTIWDAAIRSGFSGKEIRRRSGCKEWSVRGFPVDFDRWPAKRNPAELGLIETMLRNHGALPDSLIAAPATIEVIAGRVRRSRNGRETHKKAYIAPNQSDLPDQLRLIQNYWADRATNGPVQESTLNLRTLDTLCPDSAVQVYDVSDGVDECTISRFPVVPGFLGGRTIQGLRVTKNGPPELAACIAEDVAAVVDTGWPLWSLLCRNYAWDSEVTVMERAFVRLMLPFKGIDNTPKILVARYLQPVESVSHLFADIEAA